MRLAALILCILIAGCASKSESVPTKPQGSPTPQARAEPPTIEVTSKDLFDAYEKNEVAANDAYKGKPLAITGSIEKISEDPSGEIYVILKSEKQFSFTDVQCFFPNEQKAEVMKLTKGQKVKIKCTGAGKSLNVEARDCAILTK